MKWSMASFLVTLMTLINNPHLFASNIFFRRMQGEGEPYGEFIWLFLPTFLPDSSSKVVPLYQFFFLEDDIKELFLLTSDCGVAEGFPRPFLPSSISSSSIFGDSACIHLQQAKSSPAMRCVSVRTLLSYLEIQRQALSQILSLESLEGV